MEEPYGKGVATHLGPESCACGRKGMGEVLTGESVGQVLSSEISPSVCRPCRAKGKATRQATIKRESSGDTAESKTLCMRGSSMRENRETLQSPSPSGDMGRSEKPSGRTSDTHGCGESYNPIVPAKRANKAGPLSAAEPVEERGLTEGNVSQSAACRTQSRKKRVDRTEGRTASSTE